MRLRIFKKLLQYMDCLRMPVSTHIAVCHIVYEFNFLRGIQRLPNVL